MERAEAWPPHLTTSLPPPLQTTLQTPTGRTADPPPVDALLRAHAATHSAYQGSALHSSTLAPLQLQLQLQPQPPAAAASGSASAAVPPSADQQQPQQRPLWRWLAQYAEQHGIFGPPYGPRPHAHPDAAHLWRDSSAAAGSAAASSPVASPASGDSAFDLRLTSLHPLPWPPPSLSVAADEQHKRSWSSSSDSDDEDEDEDDDDDDDGDGETPDRKRRRISASPMGWADAAATVKVHTVAAASTRAKPCDTATQASTSASSALARFLPEQPTYGPEFISATGAAAAAASPNATLATTTSIGAPGAVSVSAPHLSTSTAVPEPAPRPQLYFPSVFAAQLVAISLQYNDSPATAPTHAFASVRGVPKEFLRRRPVAAAVAAGTGTPSVPVGPSSSTATAVAPAAATLSHGPSSATKADSVVLSLPAQPAPPRRLRLMPSMPGCDPVLPLPLPVRPSTTTTERVGDPGPATSQLQSQPCLTASHTGSVGKAAAVSAAAPPVASRAAPSPPPGSAGSGAVPRPAHPSIFDPVAGIPPRPLRIYIPAAHSLYNRPTAPLPALSPAAVSAAFATPVQMRT